MIWRYSASGNSYGQEHGYLKQTDPALAEGTSLTIDSNIYVGRQRTNKTLSPGENPLGVRNVDLRSRTSKRAGPMPIPISCNLIAVEARFSS